MTFLEKTLAKVTAGVLYNLQTQHYIFKGVDVPELERYVLQVYGSAPVHIKLVLTSLSYCLHVLGFLFFLKPFTYLSLKQVASLMLMMDASPLGVFRSYARFFFNIVALGALEEGDNVS